MQKGGESESNEESFVFRLDGECRISSESECSSFDEEIKDERVLGRCRKRKRSQRRTTIVGQGESTGGEKFKWAK